MSKRKAKLTEEKIRKCKCGVVFSPKNHALRYCSVDCRKSYAKKRLQTLREISEKYDLCIWCGVPLNNNGFKTCIKCRVKIRKESGKNYKSKLKCVNCKSELTKGRGSEGYYYYCNKCGVEDENN